ncbi:MAG: tetratricopeptide repeat protein, partial [Bacteroidetes bacterium]|nr:tetratricopeptide repeat protein [Bacteroidota bacterium]
MRSLLVLSVFIASLGAAVGCSTNADSGTGEGAVPAFLNLDPTAAYVGDAVCADCHEVQYQGFQDHGMAQSMFRLTSEVAVESFGSEVVVDSTTGLHYATVVSDSGYYQIEYLLDGNGNRVHELARHMEWVVGSGTSARTYLVEENGWFYELPVTWYTQQGRWDFSPGYRVANKRFDRKIADRCMTCHNSYPDPVEQTSGKYDSMPSGIGCERCHGPGAPHVEARLVSDPPEGSPDLTIINPAHLSLERRLDVCQQCHLNGTVSILREGRNAYDFRPSEHLQDWVAIFNGQEEAEEGISVISHADRMMRSECFIESLDTGRPLECTTCHDPHEGFRAEGDSYFNATCLSCHASTSLDAIDAGGPMPVHTAQANCVECHMPKADLREAPHSAFTDHFIRVIGKEDVARPEAAGDHDVLVAHFERDRRGDSESRLYEGMAYIIRGEQGGIPELMDRGISLLDNVFADGFVQSEARYLHGYAHLMRGRASTAIPSLEEAVRLEPDKVERLNALAQAYEQAGVRDTGAIERLYKQALRLQPAMSDIRINYGRFLQASGRLTEAKEAYEEVAKTEPWNLNGWYNQGTLALQEGRLDDAQRHLLRALSLDPLHGGTLSNLGLVMLQTGRIQQARDILETASRRSPDHPDVLENLGSLYLNLELDEEAAGMLERASRVNPNSAGIQAKLALAWFRLEAYAKAASAARVAIGLDPEQALA